MARAGPDGGQRGRGGGAAPGEPWWSWSDAKRAFEFLFWSGLITSARRRSFERLYDLTERVLPRAVVSAPTPAPGRRPARAGPDRGALARRGRRARPARLLPPAARRDARARGGAGGGRRAAAGGGGGLEHAGLPLARDERPAPVDGRALIGPFDSLIWERSRVERLFGFRYRIEIYVPAPKRVHGYYVLPFLLGDRLVGARRPQGRPRGRRAARAAAHAEPDAPAQTAAALIGELRAMAGWLGLERVRVERRGDLAQALRSALRA